MARRKHDIERYLSGEMTPAEMHALEKRALTDPFLAEALEGAEGIAPEIFSEDVQSLEDRAAKKPVRAIWLWPMRIAATLVILVVAGFFLVRLIGNSLYEQPDLAMTQNQKPVPPSVQAPADTAGQSPELQPEKEAVAKPESRNDEHEESPATGAGNLTALSKGKTSGPDKEADKDQVARSRQSSDESSGETVVSGKKDNFSAAQPVTLRDTSTAERVITGKVTSKGESVAGVRVAVKGESQSTTTDAGGNYKIAVDDATPDLVFSSAGFKPKEVAVGSTTTVNADLETDAKINSDVAAKESRSMPGSLEMPSSTAQASVGKDAYEQYLESHVRYPAEAVIKKIDGRVTVEFTVKADGTLDDFTVIKGIGHGCDEELIRLIRSGPEWTPATLGNTKVDEQVRVRFKFNLPK